MRKYLACAAVGVLSCQLLLARSAAAGATPSGLHGVGPVTQTLSALARVDDTDTVVLEGNVHPRARAEFAVGRTDPALPMEQMILSLKPRAGAQAELEQLLAEQQDPASSNFHRWLSPEEFATRFGAAPEDVALSIGWLQSHGFAVDEVSPGRTSINFSGTVADVETAFHTRIHDYLVDGELHHANATDPAIPRALSAVVAGIVSLHDFRSRATRLAVQPETDMSGGAYWLSPADFATIYNVNPLYAAGINGTGTSIAVVARSNLKLADVQFFRSTFNLPSNDPQFIVTGTDPGVVSTAEESEADLDVEWTGAVAPNATIKVVISKSTASTDGAYLSAQYIVNHNLSPVMTMSFGLCESDLGSSGRAFLNGLWSQAASQGISVFVSSGDSGASGCDIDASVSTGSGLAVDGNCAPPYDVCVGGSQFIDTVNPGAYWAPTNNPKTLGSALSYIPEQAWNESGDVSGGSGLWSTGGGASAFYAKPAWQVAPGVPADGARDVPDVALNAAEANAYLVVQDHTAGSSSFYGSGGTSASTQSFGGLMALVVQKAGARQGNPNPRLYQLGNAQYRGTGPVVFHDVTTGNNSVPGLTGFSAGTGYDLTTGLGSVDATALANNWVASTGPDFAISALPAAVTVAQGSSATTTITTAVSGGFNGAVSLSASGVPSGATATFGPTSIAAPGSGSSTLTLAAGAATLTGSYTVTVTGTSGATVHQLSVPLSISAGTGPDFTLSVAPTSVDVLPGRSFSAHLTTTTSGGFSSAISLSIGELPSGVTAELDQPSIAAPGAGIATVTVTVPSSATVGAFVVAVTGAGGSIEHTATVAVSVGAVSIAGCGASWVWESPLPQGNPLNAVVWAQGQVTAVGGAGTILTSPDGASWTPRTSGTGNDLYGIAWTGAQLVAAGSGGTILTSPDGVSWTARTSGTGNDLYAVTWTGTQLVAVGGNGAILTSPTGVGWTARTSGTSNDLYGLTWTGNQLVAVGYGGTILTSLSGTSWTASTAGTSNDLYGVAWTGAQLVAVGSSDTILTSPDGVSWTAHSSGTGDDLEGVVWTGVQLVAVGGNGTVVTSRDGASWTARTSGAASYLWCIAWTGAQLVAGGDSGAALTSPDAVTWTNHTSGTGSSFWGVAWTGTQLAAVGNGGTILTSPDGVSWTPRTSGTGNPLYGAAWTGDRLVAVGAGGTVLTSPDGVSWTPRTSGTLNSLNGIVWTGTQLVAVGDTGTILTSSDGTSWTIRSSGTSTNLWAVSWTGTQLAAVGDGGTILSSLDGVSWTAQASGLTSWWLSGITWTGSRLVAVGGAGTIVTSPDGVSWTAAGSGTGNDLYGVAWDGVQLVAAGDAGTVLTSPDGVSWTGHTSGTSNLLDGVTWAGSQLVAVGLHGTILSSVCSATPAATLAIGSAGATPGANACVSLSLSYTGTPDIASLSTDIMYDAGQITPIGATTSVSGKSAQGNIVSSGVYRVTVFGGTGILPAGTAASVCFDVAAGAQGTIQLCDATGTPTASDASANPVPLAGTCGSLAVQALRKAGDCNGDGTVSITELQQVINNQLGISSTGCGDCEGAAAPPSITDVQKAVNCQLGLASCTATCVH